MDRNSPMNFLDALTVFNVRPSEIIFCNFFENIAIRHLPSQLPIRGINTRYQIQKPVLQAGFIKVARYIPIYMGTF